MFCILKCGTHLGKIYKCSIFVGYGEEINFEQCCTCCYKVYFSIGGTPVKKYHSAVPHENSAFKNFIHTFDAE